MALPEIADPAMAPLEIADSAVAPLEIADPAVARPDIALIVSCEHATNRVPAEYGALFADAAALLDSHRGFDAGALDVARALARIVKGTPLVEARATRLLVDLNRSAHHPKLFSELTRELTEAAKRRLVARHYTPYRARVEALVADEAARGRFVLHVSSHSFTPVLGGRERDADVALLYDPGRRSEKAIAGEWLAALADAEPKWRLRRNYPYRGTADGLTTHLRTRFAAEVYAGLELEVNQRLVGAPEWSRTVRLIAESLRDVMGRSRGRRRARPPRRPRRLRLRGGAAIAEDAPNKSSRAAKKDSQ